MVESLNELVRSSGTRCDWPVKRGQLLKIEEELQEAVRKGQEEWEEKQPLFRFTEFSLTESRRKPIRYVPGEGLGFWDKAENLVPKALEEFVEFASKGGRHQRHLFVEDAEQGLGFVDVCRQRFDVALMNPPFGEAALGVKDIRITNILIQKQISTQHLLIGEFLCSRRVVH